MDSTQLDYIKNAPLVRVYRSASSTAGSSTYSTRFSVTDSTITNYVDGMIVCVLISVDIHSETSGVLRINSLDYKPIVYNDNTPVYSRFGQYTALWAVYNSSRTAQAYLGSSTPTTVTGCWQVMDSDVSTMVRVNDEVRTVNGYTACYRIMFSDASDNKWVPANNGTSSLFDSVKTVSQTPIDPFGSIVYYGFSRNYNADSAIPAHSLWVKYSPIGIGYSFNTNGSNSPLTAGNPVYVKCQPLANGSAVIDSATPIVQALPSQADGKIYIYLGFSLSVKEIELSISHPVYYHDGNGIRVWTGKDIDLDIPVTYSELRALRNNGNLVPKQTYRITDYETMITPYIINYFAAAGGEQTCIDEVLEFARVSPNYKQYDILVTAIDSSHLSEDCRMAKHGDETYFDNFDLPSWRIKYTLDNDRNKYDWAMDYYTGTIQVDGSTINATLVRWGTAKFFLSGVGYPMYIMFYLLTNGNELQYAHAPVYSADDTLSAGSVINIDRETSVVLATCVSNVGKGVVYYMEDMNGNKLSYDYVNIQFKEYAVDRFKSDAPTDFATEDVGDEIFYSEENDMYARFMNFYTITFLNGDGDRLAEPDLGNPDWYYTFDQYDSVNTTHTNVFYQCYDNIIGPTYNACAEIMGSGPSVYTLPYNVYQFREGYLEFFDNFLSLAEMSLGYIPFFVSGVRLVNNAIGNVFVYSSNQEVANIFENDISRIVNPVEVNVAMVGCMFKDSSHIKLCAYRTWIIKCSNLDITGSTCGLVYDSKDIVVESTNDAVWLYDTNNIAVGYSASRVDAKNSSCVYAGNYAVIVVRGCMECFIGDYSTLIAYGTTTHLTIGNNSTANNVQNCSYSSIGNYTDVVCLQGVHTVNNVTIGNSCRDIKVCGIVSYVNIEDLCSNIYVGTEDNPMRCESVTVEENSLYVNLFNPNADYFDNNNDSLCNLTITKHFKSPDTYGGTYHWVNMNSVPLNDRTEKRIGIASNGVVVVYNEADLVKQYPTLSDITFVASSPYLEVYYNGDEMMYGTNDGTIPTVYNYVWRASRAISGTNHLQVSLVAGTTYKFAKYSTSDPTAFSKVATYQA